MRIPIRMLFYFLNTYTDGQIISNFNKHDIEF